MKMKLKYLFVAISACAACISCSKEGTGAGEGRLKLSVDLSSVKSAMTPQELEANAIVNIYKADFTGLVRSYRYGDAPQEIYLAADEYRVDVLAGEISKENPATVSWEQKSYKGSSPFTIVGGQATNVKVEAKVCNTITKIEFDQSIATNMDEGYTFTVGYDLSDASTCATYTAANSGAQAYFYTKDVEPSLFWEFKGVRAKTGAEIHRTGEISATLPGKVYSMTPLFIVKDSDVSFDLKVDKGYTDNNDLIVFEPVSTGLIPSKPYEIWAWKATLHAAVNEEELTEESTVQITYSKDGENWDLIDAEKEGVGSFKACPKDLESDSEYIYKLIVDGVQVGEPLSFHTEVARQAPNASFETFSNAESQTFKSFYNPASLDPSLRKKWWDNGNHGAATLGDKYLVTMPDATDKVDGDYSCKCASQYIVVKFAAGSISSCEYGGTNGTNGYVNFGRPFTSRPSAVRLWIKYNGGTINRGQRTQAEMTGADKATFICALGTWPMSKYGGDMSKHLTDECPVQVYSADEKTFWKYDQMPETIAYSYYETEGEPEWRQLTLPFNYYKTDEIPTHIVLSFAASKFGDYFVGYDKSTLWVDKVEILYEELN